MHSIGYKLRLSWKMAQNECLRNGFIHLILKLMISLQDVELGDSDEALIDNLLEETLNNDWALIELLLIFCIRDQQYYDKIF